MKNIKYTGIDYRTNKTITIIIGIGCSPNNDIRVYDELDQEVTYSKVDITYDYINNKQLLYVTRQNTTTQYIIANLSIEN